MSDLFRSLSQSPRVHFAGHAVIGALLVAIGMKFLGPAPVARQPGIAAIAPLPRSQPERPAQPLPSPFDDPLQVDILGLDAVMLDRSVVRVPDR